MEVPNTMDALAWLRKHLDDADPDLLRSMVKAFADQLMSAEASALCNAGYGEITPERLNSRNGYRSRDFDTRAGTIELAIPKLRTGSYFPTGWSSPGAELERALVAVVAQCYVEGVSTRRVDDVVKSIALVLLCAHVFMALINPATRPALPGMVFGHVRRSWAATHHPAWLEDQDRKTPTKQ